MTHTITKLLIAITALAMVLGASSCYSERKAERQVVHAQSVYPDVVAGNCGLWYPPLESIRDIIKYKPGIPVVGETKYVTIDCDSAVAAMNKGATQPNSAGQGQAGHKKALINVPCPPDTSRVDTIDRLHEEVKVNNGKLTHCESENQKLTTRLTQTTDSRNNWRRWCLIGWGLITLVVLIRIAKAYFFKK